MTLNSVTVQFMPWDPEEGNGDAPSHYLLQMWQEGTNEWTNELQIDAATTGMETWNFLSSLVTDMIYSLRIIPVLTHQGQDYIGTGIGVGNFTFVEDEPPRKSV